MSSGVIFVPSSYSRFQPLIPNSTRAFWGTPFESVCGTRSNLSAAPRWGGLDLPHEVALSRLFRMDSHESTTICKVAARATRFSRSTWSTNTRRKGREAWAKGRRLKVAARGGPSSFPSASVEESNGCTLKQKPAVVRAT